MQTSGEHKCKNFYADSARKQRTNEGTSRDSLIIDKEEKSFLFIDYISMRHNLHKLAIPNDTGSVKVFRFTNWIIPTAFNTAVYSTVMTTGTPENACFLMYELRKLRQKITVNEGKIHIVITTVFW